MILVDFMKFLPFYIPPFIHPIPRNISITMALSMYNGLPYSRGAIPYGSCSLGALKQN